MASCYNAGILWRKKSRLNWFAFQFNRTFGSPYICIYWGLGGQGICKKVRFSDNFRQSQTISDKSQTNFRHFQTNSKIFTHFSDNFPKNRIFSQTNFLPQRDLSQFSDNLRQIHEISDNFDLFSDKFRKFSDKIWFFFKILRQISTPAVKKKIFFQEFVWELSENVWNLSEKKKNCLRLSDFFWICLRIITFFQKSAPWKKI